MLFIVLTEALETSAGQWSLTEQKRMTSSKLL